MRALGRFSEPKVVARRRFFLNLGVTSGIEANPLAQCSVELLAKLGVCNQMRARVLPALADAFASVTEPGTAFFDQLLDDAQVQQVPFARNAFAIEDVYFRLAEGRGYFVLHHFNLGPVADPLLSV